VIRFVLTAPDSILGLMSDNATKLQYLDAMGIQVWQRRHLDEPAAVPLTPETNPADDTAITAGTDVSQLDWQSLAEVVSGCQQCELHQARTQTVFGVGDRKARWVFVGEAPGADEDRQGEPFVGRAGQLLNAMLFALGLKREEVYIANVLKCRPPGNRNPEAGEVAQCTPFLLRQIALIEPRLIVAMGRFAAQTLLATDATIASLRGRVHRYAGVPLIVTYHPAYLLRNLPDKAKAWADLVFARRTLAELRARS
jgi:uracil-DNA glycosylase family 4